MKTDNFYVYATDHLMGIGQALGVVAIVSDDGEKWRAEAFVFIPAVVAGTTHLGFISKDLNLHDLPDEQKESRSYILTV